MANDKTDILHGVADYYSAKLAEHGITPRGVDWNGEDSQNLRFQQLTRIIQKESNFSINDLGCGYGALFSYLQSHYPAFSYNGCDVSDTMIASAQATHAGPSNARFYVASAPDSVADYGIASGIFNVRLEHNDSEWSEYLKSVLDLLDHTSRRGFAFNCLTAYSDQEKMRDYLYYANPCDLFDYCKRRYSRNVALLHDYELYEFTILVRKPV